MSVAEYLINSLLGICVVFFALVLLYCDALVAGARLKLLSAASLISTRPHPFPIC